MERLTASYAKPIAVRQLTTTAYSRGSGLRPINQALGRD